MSRLKSLQPRYDVLVIGGGVQGAAVALEATGAGRSVLLVERGDFCSSTSANSLKIIHGGLRYLQTANLRCSRESALEQSRLLRLAPHLVEPLPCLMGTRRSVAQSRLAMSLGTWFYDNVVCFGLSNRRHSRMMTTAQAAELLGEDLYHGCTGAALWYDARVVDSERLVLTYLKTAEQGGAQVLNYTPATGVDRGDAVAVQLKDAHSSATAAVGAGVVIDTASFLAPHRHWARAANLVLRRPSRGYAAGLRLPGESGNARGLFFATPHGDATIVGTWYFPDREREPYALSRDELQRCLADLRAMLPGPAVTPEDVALVHLGRLPVRDAARPLTLLDRPVIRALDDDGRVVSVTGVKYTTARPTARRALRVAGVPGGAPSRGAERWYGAGIAPQALAERVRGLLPGRIGQGDSEPVVRRLCRQYGSVAVEIAETAMRVPEGLERIPGRDAINAEIHYCMEHEHCRTLGDFLLRRSGLGSLAPLPEEAAEHCARVMAGYFGWTASRVDAELNELARRYDHVAREL